MQPQQAQFELAPIEQLIFRLGALNEAGARIDAEKQQIMQQVMQIRAQEKQDNERAGTAGVDAGTGGGGEV